MSNRHSIASLRTLISTAALVAASMATFGAAPTSSVSPTLETQKTAFIQSYGKLPLSFEANNGQADPKVRFFSRGDGYGLYLTADQAILALDRNTCDHRHTSVLNEERPVAKSACRERSAVIHMELVGKAAGASAPIGEQLLPGTANYFVGNSASEWRTSVSTFSKVRYASVYPGIDLLYYGNQRQLEYDFVVAPNAETEAIRIRFAGVQKLRLSAEGDLILSSRRNSIAFHKPAIYQIIGEQRSSVSGRFQIVDRNTIGFAIGSYDHEKSLVIDPVLAYSTYLGGNSTSGDEANAITVDTQGNAYVTGMAGSANFPVSSGVVQSANAGAASSAFNAFVSKLNPSGTALVYSTYLGGSCNTHATAIAVDASGNAYITGETFATNFPTTSGAYQTASKASSTGYTAFVSKLNATGTALVYSTYLGGSGNGSGTGDIANAIALDSSENAYVAGSTYSANFPVTTGAFQTTNNGAAEDSYNAFVTKLNSSGSLLVYSTFLGGSPTALHGGGDQAYALAVDASGNAFLTGSASTSSFPTTTGAYQVTNAANLNAQTSAFVTELNPTGTAPVYSTFLGGSKNSGGYAIAIDGSGYAYVAGSAMYTDFPVTSGTFQSSNKGSAIAASNAFIAKLNQSGTGLVYSTWLGGSGLKINAYLISGDSANAIAVDAAGDVFVAGTAYSTNFPVTSGAFQATNYGAANATFNAFVTELNPSGTALLYSTYIGGTGIPVGTTSSYIGDNATGLALDPNGGVYVGGVAESTNFPVTNGSYQLSNKSSANAASNAFISKFEMVNPVASTTSLNSSANPTAAGASATLTATVAPTSGTSVPSGDVSFTVDGVVVTTVVLNSNAQATYSTSGLAAGTHTIAVSYAGNSSLASSTSATLSQMITAAVTEAATPILSPAAGTYGTTQSVTLSDATSGATIYYTTNGTTPTTSSMKYSGAFSISSTSTIEAVAVANGLSNSGVASATYTITPTLAKPTFSIAAGSYASSQSVILSDATGGAAIYYTTNGTTPTTSSTKYTSAIAVSKTTTIEAIAVLSGNTTSAVASAVYTITPVAATPTFSISAGTYASAQSITLADATSGATIYYTTNGTAPTTSSTKYTTAIAVSKTTTIEAIAVLSAYANSPVASATYTITPVAATPTFSISAGTYATAQSITLADATSGATIYYTTNGTAPTTSSTRYTTAIPVSATTTIKAIAAVSSYANSEVGTATYTISAAPAAVTGAATLVSTTGATLNGTVVANNATTEFAFAYGTSKSSLSSYTAKTGALQGISSTAVSATLMGLKSSTVYYFKITANNANGTVSGSILTFTTK